MLLKRLGLALGLYVPGALLLNWCLKTDLPHHIDVLAFATLGAICGLLAVIVVRR